MSEFPDTRDSLIARIKDPADGMAWAEFLGIYRPVVYRLARKRGVQDADAQDVTQQVFLSVANAVERWQPGPDRPPFRAWLVTITRNAVNKALSRRKPDAGTGSSSVAQLLNQKCVTETDSEFDMESRHSVVRYATAQIRPEFSETTWHLFWESVVVGRSISEVALESGRTPGAVYMARFKVLQRLKVKAREVSGMWDCPSGGTS